MIIETNCDQSVLPIGSVGCGGAEDGMSIFEKLSRWDINLTIGRVSKLAIEAILCAKRMLGKFFWGYLVSCSVLLTFDDSWD